MPDVGLFAWSVEILTFSVARKLPVGNEQPAQVVRLKFPSGRGYRSEVTWPPILRSRVVLRG
jgi:hypothetical protein